MFTGEEERAVVTVFALEQINSQSYLRRRSDGGWMHTREIATATFYAARDEANEALEIFTDWLAARRLTAPRDFYYPDGHWCSWDGGVNHVADIQRTTIWTLAPTEDPHAPSE